ncbi:Protein kinase domain protein [Piscirickettsia salmonis]|uniref:kinase n=1 Tax=Piscirickettsia salmonis TaxID=1238 RepID=UPI0012B8F173|nr:kinase [Piscirickettsia salmonis]QGP51118.1 Protein kinase domain protein [Piscirickettsia salmonis]QGP53726.1 Protein kinase domain protein [Piscirickettsia salmonis]QGP60363.1 Protein kinase domain protein [Piscirickettsia salmonis]QGP63299.1 Protein kinase domain protein [Piscirickettsia salmonis]
MPGVKWRGESGRTKDEQKAIEWRIAKKYLEGSPPGTEIHPRHTKRARFIDDETGKAVTITHRYLKGSGPHIFVKSNGKVLGKGTYGEVTFAETEDGCMWAIKVSAVPEGNIAFDVGKALRPFSQGGKHYQVYQFLGVPLDKFLIENTLSEEQKYDLAISLAREVHHFHAGTHSHTETQYVHLDIKPDNVCVDKDLNANLIDYGLSQKLATPLKQSPGSPCYVSNDYHQSSKAAKDTFALLRTIGMLPKTRLARWLKPAFPDLRYVDDRPAIFKMPIHNRQLWDLLDTRDAKIRKTSPIDICVKLILIKFGLCTLDNLAKALADPQQFDQSYQHLELLGLNQAVYVKLVLDTPSLLDQLARYKELFLLLNQFGLGQSHYVQQVLADPMQFAESYRELVVLGLNQVAYIQLALDTPSRVRQFETHRELFLILNRFKLHQPGYVQRVLDEPLTFSKNYWRLVALGLDQAQYVQQLLNYPDCFDRSYQHLKCLNLNQGVYLQLLLDFPGLDLIEIFEGYHEVFLILNQLGLNQKDYVQQVIDRPEWFDENYRCLQAFGLDLPRDVQCMLDYPELFDQNYQRLKFLGLNQFAYVQQILDHPQQFDQVYRFLGTLGLDEPGPVQKILEASNLVFNIFSLCEEVCRIKTDSESGEQFQKATNLLKDNLVRSALTEADCYAQEQIFNLKELVHHMNSDHLSEVDKMRLLKEYENCAKKDHWFRNKPGWAKLMIGFISVATAAIAGTAIGAFASSWSGPGAIFGSIAGGYLGSTTAATSAMGATVGFGVGCVAGIVLPLFFDQASEDETLAKEVVSHAVTEAHAYP